jgi:pyrimidine-nucleoside phosphorylase
MPARHRVATLYSVHMNPVDIIALKRDGAELTEADLRELIDGFVSGSVPDYQMSAFAMAVFFQGMSDHETVTLTRLMLESGVSLNWNDGPDVVDKHSTGGVGDKVSLVLAPVLAALGFRVPMISGRGLGPTGGTLDKLESIPGFRTDLSISEMQNVVNDVGCVITGATKELVPADRKLYALRDVTATVPSIPLITASILSKKLAESLDALVLDVKVGSGAFMKSRAQAEALAQTLVRVGNQFGVSTVAFITDMDQPLGQMCGNAVEVAEVIECLKGGGPADLRELTLTLAQSLLEQTNRSNDAQQVEQAIDSGAAFEKFSDMVRAQGGDIDASVSIADNIHMVESDASGFVSAIDTELIGKYVIELGGGRQRLSDEIDHSVGIEVLAKLGDRVEGGQPLARVFHSGGSADFKMWINAAITFADDAPAESSLIQNSFHRVESS